MFEPDVPTVYFASWHTRNNTIHNCVIAVMSGGNSPAQIWNNIELWDIKHTNLQYVEKQD